MKNFFSVFTVGLALAAQISFAQNDLITNEVGNGGDAVVCKNSGGRIISVELLDLFEAKARFGLAIDIPGSGYAEKVANAVKRIAMYQKALSGRIEYDAKRFESDAKFIPGVTLVDIRDSFETVVPNDCAIEQLVIQKEPSFPGEKYYTVNKDLWDLLDDTNKAAMIMHEVLFKFALTTVQQTNSIPTRFFNGNVLSKNFEKLGLPKYIAIAQSVKFGLEEKYNFQSLTIGDMWSQGTSGTVEVGGMIDLENYKGLSIAAGESFHLNSDGTVFGFALAAPYAFKVKDRMIRFIGDIRLLTGEKIYIGKLAEPTYFNYRGQSVLFKGSVDFFSNRGEGVIENGMLAQDLTIPVQGVCDIILKENSRVDFDENWNLKYPDLVKNSQICVSDFDGKISPVVLPEDADVVYHNSLLPSYMTRSFGAQHPFDVVIPFKGKSTKFRVGRYVNHQYTSLVFQNLGVRSGDLAEDTNFVDQNGQTVLVKENEFSTFDFEGFLEN